MFATTLALGVTVAASWFLFGGTAAFRGPLRALEEAWLLIYGSQLLLAAGVGLLLVRLVEPPTPARTVGLIAAAWTGEWAALFVGGTILSNELVPNGAWFFWLIGTGGPIQPLAAIAGAAVGSRMRGRR